MNKEVTSNNTAKLSTRTGLIYTQDRKWEAENNVNAYYFVALDFRTGEVVWEKLMGTGTHFESPWAVVDELGGMLEEQCWTADPMPGADGPMGTAAGYRKDDQICWASAMWTPDASANCPADQPISACELTPEQQIYTVTLNIGNHKWHVRQLKGEKKNEHTRQNPAGDSPHSRHPACRADHLRRQRPGYLLPADRTAAPAKRCAQRADRAAR